MLPSELSKTWRETNNMGNFKVNSNIKDVATLVKLIPERKSRFRKGSTDPIPATYAVNATAQALHPAEQKMTVKEIEVFSDDVKSYILAPVDGSKPAYFRAGQYISVKLNIGNAFVARPYSIASTPSQALQGTYMITVKRVPDGFVSGYILDNWQAGTQVTVSAPDGTFCYEGLRDEKTVVALAGGSGITPFLSLAGAIADGTEDANLVLLYGCRNENEILFKERFDKISSECDKVKVVYVLSDSEAEGYEHGFITAELIKKYAPESYSVFVCGPAAMYRFVGKEIEKLGLDKRHIRFELQAGTKPVVEKAEEYSCVVICRNKEKTIPCRNDESILTALERAGIAAPSMCRSGECGFCRSKLISGEVFVADDNDGRRVADVKLGYIHPCCSYPQSDITIKIN